MEPASEGTRGRRRTLAPAVTLTLIGVGVPGGGVAPVFRRPGVFTHYLPMGSQLWMNRA